MPSASLPGRLTMPSIVRPEALALQRLFHWEQAAPGRVVFTQPVGDGRVRDYTWAQAMDQVRRMAAHLRQLGLKPGEPVAILSKNTAHWLMSDFAIWLAGGVSVPLYPTISAATLRQILAHCGAGVVFVGKLDDWAEVEGALTGALSCIAHPLAPAPALQRFPTWDGITAVTDPLPGRPWRGPEELATIMYTSGTTGAPKGVMHSFGGCAWGTIAGLKRVPDFGPDSRMLSYLPLAHVAERGLVEHALLATGMHIYFAESLATFSADVQRARPTVFFSVPRLWAKFQQGVHARLPPTVLDVLLALPGVATLVRRRLLGALGLRECRFAAGGAAPMPPELLAWYARLGLEIVEVYGMTENCGISHATLPGHPRPGTVGQPYEGVQARLDPATQEIEVRAPCVMMGYYREPELTRAAFTDDGWLRTGDKGAFDEEGNLRITGRVKDLFKTSKGKYVAPAPIEARLATHPAIEACCVTGAHRGQPLALAMLTPDAAQRSRHEAGRRELQRSLGDHLAAVNASLDHHERLDGLVLMREAWSVENDLLTPTFKVRRGRIDERFAAEFEGWAGAQEKVIWHGA